VTWLMPFGRLDEAAADLETALDVDPLAMWPRGWLSVMLWFGRQYERSIEQARVMIDLDPNHFIAWLCAGHALREAGRLDEAIHAYRRAAGLSGQAPMIIGWLGLALAQIGDTEGARELADRLLRMPPSVHVPATNLAWIHFGLGEIDEFFACMERAIDARDHMITPLRSYPFLDPVRDDPRFAALLRKMNLA
jgi:tetratricopeptide (TPR) repeat protein